MWLGKFQNYHWLVSREPIRSLAELIKKHHKGEVLHITAFDSGPILPNEEEIKAGWAQFGKILVSPSLSGSTQIPYDQFDEWYVSKDKLSFPEELELFVNYGSFTMVSPEELTKDDDPTWERGRCDFLYPLQARFWKQIAVVNPNTYVSSGDLDIMVSKNKTLIGKTRKSILKQYG